MNGLYRAAERLMGMDADSWARHASPWSVYSRFTILPLLALAVWSRVWIGGWAWLAVALVLAWTWANPRVFAPPRDLDAWASRGVLGERVLIGRRDEVPAHHRRWAALLSVLSLPGTVAMAWGLWALDAAWVVFGTALTMIPKIWFADRMVWLYSDWITDTGRELGDV
ncbi:DUF6653 family protein [Roseovarius sp.]|uniref:DUF6653 family protein n=1 Tax=Roseovarius sp. TaxID=1486281 RepID=UPI003D0BB789